MKKIYIILCLLSVSSIFAQQRFKSFQLQNTTWKEESQNSKCTTYISFSATEYSFEIFWADGRYTIQKWPYYIANSMPAFTHQLDEITGLLYEQDKVGKNYDGNILVKYCEQDSILFADSIITLNDSVLVLYTPPIYFIDEGDKIYFSDGCYQKYTKSTPPKECPLIKHDLCLDPAEEEI